MFYQKLRRNFYIICWNINSYYIFLHLFNSAIIYFAGISILSSRSSLLKSLTIEKWDYGNFLFELFIQHLTSCYLIISGTLMTLLMMTRCKSKLNATLTGDAIVLIIPCLKCRGCPNTVCIISPSDKTRDTGNARIQEPRRLGADTRYLLAIYASYQNGKKDISYIFLFHNCPVCCQHLCDTLHSRQHFITQLYSLVLSLG